MGQQISSFPKNGVDEPKSGMYVFMNATIYLDYKTRLEHANLLIKDGKVLNCGGVFEIPAGTIKIEFKKLKKW